MPTNVALGAADILVTDYSSIFFDYLNRQKPVVFYIPDLEDYKSYRDLYVSPEELPGPVARNADELIDILLSVKTFDDMPAVRKNTHDVMKSKYVPFDDGHVSGRVLDAVVYGRHEGVKIQDDHADGRTRILIYGGGMIPNGITTSVLNLLDNINYEKYDVTLLCPFSMNPAQQHSFSQININARAIFRVGTFNGSYVSNSIRNRVLKKGSNNWLSELKSQKKLWESEWIRCLGDAKFDHMIDFSGYTPFWGTLFLHGPAKARSIWLHNDLAADAHRSIAGNTPLKNGLYATFSIYRKFENLVSVSQGLSEINKTSLQKWAPDANFCSASNTVNAAKIEVMAQIQDDLPRDYTSATSSSDAAIRSAIMGKLVTNLIHPERNIDNEIQTKLQLSPGSESFFTFFSAGRLSPEKNHSRLIKAFSIVHSKNPNSRLVIAGDGPLKDELKAEIVQLGLTESVKLVGHTKNPYQLMGCADAFVLSSDYEGQPMVLLEALVLGVPVITTSFGSVAGALPPRTGTIVSANENALAEAMLNASRNPTSRPDFDADAYNTRAIRELETVIDG